ncbi:MAG: 2-amino-4-hydroxy-6-hydroxymethyldihydropteridine diphosphokinase [Betaproteobacteria bacterium]|nr:2-amino-4-hydroxy-6-hydroxymethyldihydropteridine diphosphokinase [Betaproteobacteria bacterium]
MNTAYIALGSNLDNPLAQLQTALAALAALPSSRLGPVSSFYRSAPVVSAESPEQPDFINAVAALESALPPPELLEHLLAQEAAQGRQHSQGIHAPRPLDLDLLLYGEHRCNTPRLVLPHPRLHLRAFVLLPLTEIAPEIEIPGHGTAAAWLPAVSLQRIERIAPPPACAE